MFQTYPIGVTDWITVFKISFPVIIIDEALKFVARRIEGEILE